MAKETKKTISISEVNEENFSEQLKKANTFSKEIVELSQQNKEKEDKERQAREFGRISDKATYLNLRMVAESKYAKKVTEIQKDLRNKSKALLDRVAAGELTAIEYDDELNKTVSEAVKEIDKVGEELRKDRKELRNQFPNSWSYAWENPYERINRAIENNKDRN